MYYWIIKYNNLTDIDFKNITLTNYDGTKQISIKSSKVIDFDENLQLAKQKIDECFAKWGAESHPNIKAVVDKYFKVDKKGVLNKNAILGLFKFQMNDKDWDEAMRLIQLSIVDDESREYLMLRTRKNKDADWELVNLNLSSISVDE